MTYKRFVKPRVVNEDELVLVSYITNLRGNPPAFQRAHLLMPMYQAAITYLEKCLIGDMNMDWLFDKINNSYTHVDYKATLRLLIRTRLVSVIREDMTLILCKYLDFMEQLRQIQQLRDENASDMLITSQTLKMLKNGLSVVGRAAKFQTDYIKVFREGLICVGDLNIMTEVEGIMKQFKELAMVQKEAYNV